jgi:hypothetical protein
MHDKLNFFVSGLTVAQQTHKHALSALEASRVQITRCYIYSRHITRLHHCARLAFEISCIRSRFRFRSISLFFKRSHEFFRRSNCATSSKRQSLFFGACKVIYFCSGDKATQSNVTSLSRNSVLVDYMIGGSRCITSFVTYAANFVFSIDSLLAGRFADGHEPFSNGCGGGKKTRPSTTSNTRRLQVIDGTCS